MPEPDELVTVASCSYQEATFFRSVLESENIEVFLPEQHSWNFVPAGSGFIELQVHRSDLERARELLSSLRETSGDAEASAN